MTATEVRVVLGAACRVRQNGVGLVDQRRHGAVAAQVRMQAQLLHQRAVGGADDGLVRVRLHLQDAVVVASIGSLHRGRLRSERAS